jgi:hypothetical protein
MGYCISMAECEFTMTESMQRKAFPVVKRALLKQLTEDAKQPPFQGKTIASGGSAEGNKWVPHYAWVENWQIENAENIRDILEAFRYKPTEDYGDIESLDFDGEKIGDEVFLFGLLAPYVKSGSFLNMVGEDGAHWRWLFKNGRFKEVVGKVVYEE